MMTLFSWRYWGWGNATEQVVEAFDIAERARGFKQPIFVDCRLKRQGRAKGFVNDSFKNLVGTDRYRHYVGLGNAEIATGGNGIRIKDASAIADLLELARAAQEANRRVLFYCACEYPDDPQKGACRVTIADLLLKRADEASQRITVVEWPGGTPGEVRIKVDRNVFSPIIRGPRKSILFSAKDLRKFGDLPWASIATVERDGSDETGHVLVGPARFATSSKREGYWYLPVIEPAKPKASKETLRADAARWRRAHGLEPRRSD